MASAEPVEPAWAHEPAPIPDSWGAVALADVFEAAPHLGTRRLVVCARSGSGETTDTLMATLAGQRIGPDHSFSVTAPLADDTIASIGMPEAESPVVASEDGGPDRVVTPRRGGWSAWVRPTPAALAALRKRLEDAGLSVEFRLLREPLPERTAGGDADRADAAAWSSPASPLTRAAWVPIVVDSLPE